MKGKTLRKHSLHREIAASVFLKLFIMLKYSKYLTNIDPLGHSFKYPLK